MFNNCVIKLLPQLWSFPLPFSTCISTSTGFESRKNFRESNQRRLGMQTNFVLNCNCTAMNEWMTKLNLCFCKSEAENRLSANLWAVARHKPRHLFPSISSQSDSSKHINFRFLAARICWRSCFEHLYVLIKSKRDGIISFAMLHYLVNSHGRHSTIATSSISGLREGCKGA